jgi:hypothetical protein
VSTQPPPPGAGLSTQVKVAAALTSLVAVGGAAVMVLGFRLFTVKDDLFFAIMPAVASAATLTGAWLLGWGGQLTSWLLRRNQRARAHTFLVGAMELALGLMALFTSFAVPGLALMLHGGALAYLMLTPEVGSDLGAWKKSVQQPAPWGSTPGTGLWSPEPPAQGPWSPDPRTLPTFSWKNHSGPRVPWWQTWEAGLRQGIPLWELLLLCVALLGGLGGALAVPFLMIGSAAFGTLRPRDTAWAWVLLVLPLAWAVVWWLERRMRERLARGRR